MHTGGKCYFYFHTDILHTHFNSRNLFFHHPVLKPWRKGFAFSFSYLLMFRLSQCNKMPGEKGKNR